MQDAQPASPAGGNDTGLSETGASAGLRLGRRALLGGLVFALPAGWLAGTSGGALAAVEASEAAPAGFMALSRRLTGHDEIPEDLADAAFSALSAREADFPARYARLEQALAADASPFETLVDAPALADPANRATALAIISAWYLGRVGKVEAQSETASTLVTFTAALMWAPTIDVTVIPTYARGAPGNWADPPPGVTPR